MLVLYYCGADDFRVKVLVNEMEMVLPVCDNKVYCSFYKLWSRMWPKLSTDFRSICQHYGGYFNSSQVCTAKIDDEYLNIQSPQVEDDSTSDMFPIAMAVAIATISVIAAAPFFTCFGGLLVLWHQRRRSNPAIRRVQMFGGDELDDDNHQLGDDDDDDDDGL
jgi:hypothetical protein